MKKRKKKKEIEIRKGRRRRQRNDDDNIDADDDREIKSENRIREKVNMAVKKEGGKKINIRKGEEEEKQKVVDNPPSFSPLPF